MKRNISYNRGNSFKIEQPLHSPAPPRSNLHPVRNFWLARAISSIGAVPMIYGKTFLCLEQIAPSRAAHTRTCCEDFYGCRAGEMASENSPKFFMLSAHNSTRLCLLEICLSIFVVNCSSLSEVRQCHT